MRKLTLKAWTIRIATAAMLCAGAVVQSSNASNADAVRAALAKQNPAVSITNVRPSPATELYMVSLGGSSGYVTADGRYIVMGDMYEVATRKNVSEEQRKVLRAEIFSKVDWNDAIVFSPEQPRHTVIVFTDVDCTYCRKLHTEIAKLNELGIAVRYLAYPRSGPGTESWSKMEAVWCSTDRRDALTRAKRGESIEKTAGCVAPQIAAEYSLGEQLSVHGTPMIMLEDGSVVGGYLPTLQLAQALDRLAAHEPVAQAGRQSAAP